MAKKKTDEVVEEVQPTESKNENKIETPKTDNVVEEGGDMKVKLPKMPKQFVNKDDNEPAKVDLRKKPEVVEEEVTKVNLDEPKDEVEEKPVEEVKEEVQEETPVLEEVIEEEPKAKTEEEVKQEVEEEVEKLQENVEEAVQEAQETGQQLPENIQKVVEFMNETGGSLEDYVKLNQDFSKYDDNTLLREYFKQTKPHLTDDEVSFVMEDLYSWDDETDDAKDIRRKKLALKEQVANAKSHLDGLKSRYYEEIKAGVKLTPDQKKAIDFFNRYNEASEENQKIVEEQRNVFTSKTEKLFNDDFKGFEYKVGDKKYRFNVKDAAKVKDNQSDINNFVGKFLDKKQQLMDPQGYHKALFTANNPDAIANHFYEQGKADAIKESMAKAKNVNMSPNMTHTNSIQSGGTKFKVISGDDSSKLRVKINKIN
tara:strand:- start:286 stop:1563 length:1278 start_codon:yes stop_codon:yes gene_type:complete